MKWFKHLTDAHTDEALLGLREEFGTIAYAWWWLILELVAGATVANGYTRPEEFTLTLPATTWAAHLGTRPDHLRRFLRHPHAMSICSAHHVGMLITISVPKLASIRDNHSLRRGAATESLRSVEEELRKTKYKKERKTSLNSSELKSSFSPKHNPKEADPPHPALSIVHGGKVHA